MTVYPRLAVAAVCLAAVLVPPAPAVAGCITCSCTVSTQSLAFGNYNPSDIAATTVNARVTVNCNSLVLAIGTIDVGINAGGSGTTAARTMANGATKLSYNIYQDAAYATVWGNGGSNGSLQTLSLLNVATYNAALTAYGRIPARQWVKPGVYTDSVVVTITY